MDKSSSESTTNKSANAIAITGENGTEMNLEVGKSEPFSFLDLLNIDKNFTQARYQQLITQEKVREQSIYALRCGIFADAVVGSILQPNYAIMVSPEAHEESFDSTSPFDFSSATYFIPMTALLGVSIASAFCGKLSDRIGRKPILQMCMGGSVLGTTLKWCLRKTFWGFCAANFANGLVSGGLPVALAYLGDVFPTYKEKQNQFGLITGFYVLGNSFGGVIAILMESQGLFAPLWVGVALMFVAFVAISKFLIEPKDLKLLPLGNTAQTADDASDITPPPETINKKVMWNVIVGAFVDNVGSNGLFPICLSPLAFNQFYNDFVQNEEEPVLSLVGYKWMSVLIALMVVPSTMITPRVFNKIGPAGGCVFGNIMTAILTVALYLLGTGKANSGYLAGFVVCMYTGFPFTVISQLSTGPMLDKIAPAEYRGYVQGLNSTVMNIATALAPWVLGIIADGVGTSAAVFCGVGVSLAAAAINTPLIFVRGMGPPVKKPGKEHRPMKWEDADVVEKILQGEYVPGAVRDKLNDERVKKGLPYLAASPGTFENDKERLSDLHRLAKEEFLYERNQNNFILSQIAERRGEEQLAVDLKDSLEHINNSLEMLGDEQTDKVYQELGQWFADYIRYAGYYGHVNQLLMKQMILAAFPVLLEDEKLTPNNVEQYLANKEQVYARYVKEDEPQEFNVKNLLGDGSTRVLYG